MASFCPNCQKLIFIVDEKFSCQNCGGVYPVKDPIVVQIFQGKRSNPGEPNSEAYKQWIINESYGNALDITNDVKCKCGGDVAYIIDSNDLYRFVCKKCHKLVNE